jgi:hypothetical protein
MRNKVPSDAHVIDTTSRSKIWTRGLSPFFCGSVDLYDDYVSQNVENAWQFSKVYAKHVDGQENPTDEYFKWAVAGWEDTWAHRYPAGKGAVPLYSWWDGEKLGYIEARKKIYAPLYAKAVATTEAYKKLAELHEAGGNLWLRDFDGYDFRKLGLTYKEVLNNPQRKMGHAFVLAMMLDGERCWEQS